MVKKLIFVLVCILTAVSAFAQNTTSDLDSTTFKGRFDNKEFNIYIVLDAYHNNVIVPRQEVYGEMSGYLGDYQDGCSPPLPSRMPKPLSSALSTIMGARILQPLSLSQKMVLMF